MGCIVAKALDPSPPDGSIRDFWHISGVLIDTDDNERVQHFPAGVLYVYNSRLVYEARHCTLARTERQLQFDVCDLGDVTSSNKFTSRKDGKAMSRSVVDAIINADNGPVHIGFQTKEAEKIAQRLREVCAKHRQKPKIFQFNSVDVDGVEIDLP